MLIHTHGSRLFRFIWSFWRIGSQSFPTDELTQIHACSYSLHKRVAFFLTTHTPPIGKAGPYLNFPMTLRPRKELITNGKQIF